VLRATDRSNDTSRRRRTGVQFNFLCQMWKRCYHRHMHTGDHAPLPPELPPALAPPPTEPLPQPPLCLPAVLVTAGLAACLRASLVCFSLCHCCLLRSWLLACSRCSARLLFSALL
jgi:hypothetical protein